MSPSPPDGQVAEPEASVETPRGVRVKIVCSHCDRVFVRHSRKGYTAKCPHCDTVNPGPALLAEQAKGKADGARRRVARRERRAAEGEPAGAAADPGGDPRSPAAPAPVRRKRTPAPAAASTDAQPGSEAKGEGASPRGRPAVGAPATPRPRRGLIETLLYGGDDDGE